MMFSSSAGGKKATPQQEMVQVGISASPFWKAPQRDTPPLKKTTRDSSLVVGAAYSHADILKFDSLNISGSGSRPRTPPSATSALERVPTASPTTRPSKSPPFKQYMNFLSSTNDDWTADEAEDMYDYESDDGDDFGLPSLSNMKRRTRKKAEQSRAHTGDTLNGGGRERRYSNSEDIAIERPAASYPMPKKSEGKILRPQYKEILRDPANALHLINHPSIPANATPKEVDAINSRITRINKFKKLLQASTMPLPDLRSLAWSGVPEEVRAMTWQLLLRSSAPPRGTNRGLDEAIWHQISIDVPRTNPHIELYSYEATQRSLERILYVWAVRHPASGYVQGINDLVTPFWQVFLGTYITDPDIESGMDPGQLPKAVLDAVEADSFWCLTKLLDGIQDHYIVAQPGIQRQVSALRDLTARIDAGLAKHLEKEQVEFIQFSFRWMNCLLMREISVKNTIRMWDTYMAEEQGFSEFHLYVCAAFLVKWSDKLVKMDFQEIMMFLQSLPTRDWTEKDIELLLSEAYIWQSLFKGSSAHLKGQGGEGSRSASMNFTL
ncbi:rab-GTPase-TBC domain-containing protein [Apiosordaria backusii]|uniref:Rab-GTPase-TBC domain-containing protein n=1 Tax=Apiosordaria backusii TaxID=314023 RepID=A0AA40A3R0_9PEZI|nr:rab-GTPase-TBC domain-containing protein [Apiosordaria backusii]